MAEKRDIGALVDIDSKQSANKLLDAPAIGRRPGKPKGHPKPPGSGRQKGQRNRVTAEIKELAQVHGPKMLRALVQLAEKSPDDRVRLAAQREVLDRAYGKPLSPQEITGKDGTPLNPAPEASNTQRAQALAFIFAKQLDESGYQMDRSGKIFPRYTPASSAPTSDCLPEIEAVQAAILPQTPAPGPTPEEEEAARRAREDERYLLTRSEEQGFGEVNRPNVIRMRPHGK